jgi:small-conductance mechanosensitive channel
VPVLAGLPSMSGALGDSQVSGWDLLLALLVLIVSWLLSRWAGRATRDLANRLDGLSDDMRALASKGVRYFVLLLGVGVALSILGAPIEPLLTAAVIVGIVAALALRGVAENFAAGVVIQTRRPIHVDDEIDSLGFVGVVKELNGRSVVIETPDGRIVHLPNSKVLDNPIINNTTTGMRRSEVEVRAARGDHEADLRGLVATAIAAVPGVLLDPAPDVHLTGSDPERFTLLARVWHDSAAGSDVVDAMIERIVGALSEAGSEASLVSPQPPAPLTPPARL